MAKEKTNRLDQQRAALGVDRLAKKAEKLNAAMATNEIPPPPSMLTDVPIPDITNIKSLPSTLSERDKHQNQRNHCQHRYRKILGARDSL